MQLKLRIKGEVFAAAVAGPGFAPSPGDTVTIVRGYEGADAHGGSETRQRVVISHREIVLRQYTEPTEGKPNLCSVEDIIWHCEPVKFEGET